MVVVRTGFWQTVLLNGKGDGFLSSALAELQLPTAPTSTPADCYLSAPGFSVCCHLHTGTTEMDKDVYAHMHTHTQTYWMHAYPLKRQLILTNNK